MSIRTTFARAGRRKDPEREMEPGSGPTEPGSVAGRGPATEQLPLVCPSAASLGQEDPDGAQGWPMDDQGTSRAANRETKHAIWPRAWLI